MRDKVELKVITNMALGMDNIITSEARSRAEESELSVVDIAKRGQFISTPNGMTTFVFDGIPLLEFGEIEVKTEMDDQFNYKIKATQRYRKCVS